MVFDMASLSMTNANPLAGRSVRDPAAADASSSRLSEIADLLALAIARAHARRTEAQSRESSTGLCAGIERVLGPETVL
jgi:hypothetical protein